MHIEAYGRSECGPVRENNEDSLLLDLDSGIFVVADGMGGHAAGEVASNLAVRTIHNVLMGAQDPDETRLVSDVSQLDGSSIMRERLRYAMNQASVRIRRESEAHAEMRGMGTTVVMTVIDGNQAHIAHVGDSRAYLFRKGTLQQLTRDHTVVQQEIDAGRLTPELARLLPHRNILTQSVGYHGAVEPDTGTRALEPGDLILLCSDGLTDPLDDNALRDLLEAHPADALPDILVDEAIRAGGEDNVTVIVLTIED